jgi:hypothetical protein
VLSRGRFGGDGIGGCVDGGGGGGVGVGLRGVVGFAPAALVFGALSFIDSLLDRLFGVCLWQAELRVLGRGASVAFRH